MIRTRKPVKIYLEDCKARRVMALQRLNPPSLISGDALRYYASNKFRYPLGETTAKRDYGDTSM
jgi:hypothetical protein